MKKGCIFLLLFLLITAMAVPASANAAEPPTLIILSSNLPQDAVLTVITAEGDALEMRDISRSDKAWESQHRLWFPWYYEGGEQTVLQVAVGDNSFTCPMPEAVGTGYRTVMTLDYEAQTLELGQDSWRQPLLTALRVALTLLSEGLVFCLFGFRQKRSWLIFAVVNLLTQGWLNIMLNGYAFSTGYIVLALVGMEICIFAAEAVVFPLALRERKVWHRILCALTANAVSLALGIFILGSLPL